MFGYGSPRFPAAVNGLPVALLRVTVLFDRAAWRTKRSSLEAAARWTLWAGVAGGWVAVLAGLEAEDVIEHGEAIHELMETHETLALVTMGIFTVVLAWRLLRRARLGGAEQTALRLLSVAGLVGIVWTGRIGGKLMFERSEEHTSELQSRPHLVCRLLLEKKKRPRGGDARELLHRGEDFTDHRGVVGNPSSACGYQSRAASTARYC